MIRTVLMACWILMASTPLVGQVNYDPTTNKDYKKLHKIASKGKYKTLEKKAAKLKSKKSSSPVAYYFLTIAHYQLNLSSDSPGKQQRHLSRALSYYNKAKNRDINRVIVYPDTALARQLHVSCRNAANFYFDNGEERKAKPFVKALAADFLDTVLFYEELFPPPKPAKPVVTKEEKPAQVAITNYGTRFVTPSNKVSRDQLVAYSRQFVGTRYKWGGESPGGFDCSGFVLYVYRNFGYDFNHSSREIAKIGSRLDSSRVKKGDIVFFGTRNSNGTYKISHMGMIYSAEPGKWQVIHSTNKGVLIDDLYGRAYWTRKMLFINNIIDPEQGS